MLIEIHVFENGVPKGIPYLAPFGINDQLNCLLEHIQDRIGVKDPEIIWESKILSFTGSAVTFGTVFGQQRNIMVRVSSRIASKLQDEILDINQLEDLRRQSTPSITKQQAKLNFDLESNLITNHNTTNIRALSQTIEYEQVRTVEGENSNFTLESKNSPNDQLSYIQKQVYEMKSASELDNEMLEIEFNNYKVIEEIDSLITPKASINEEQCPLPIVKSLKKLSKKTNPVKQTIRLIAKPKTKNSGENSQVPEIQDENLDFPEVAFSQQLDPIFEVEKVLDAFKLNDRLWLYLIKWKGFPMEKCTWEPQRCLGDKDTVRQATELRNKIKRFSRNAIKKEGTWKVPTKIGQEIEQL